MRVTIPSPLFQYTGRKDVEAAGSTLADVLAELDRQFPGLRFRMVDEQDATKGRIGVSAGEGEAT